MWPFDKSLRDQNALEKYSRWLRRWLMGGNPSRIKRSAAHLMQP
ncbi:hypothetical protein [Desulfoscipio gibsoniae]|uniref:Uncharacterized protein n=1 Tax=Desulfoscipio gibsoniae DSM 7213 TaxID=767817 RepID=R4KT87_9FIRM|nr:hypothetical protein [Desulfoscipio gibsoniae]AGL03810.1 hypothetical protein Desgi_4583 [Desulfoscipio gibsoniae DSM 7213]